MLYTGIILISALSFLFYSIKSIFSKHMISEYERWGFSNLRLIIVFFQISSAICLIIGICNVFFLSIASLTLSIMMIGAIIVRIKIKDSLFKTLPAIFYAALNFIIFYIALYSW